MDPSMKKRNQIISDDEAEEVESSSESSEDEYVVEKIIGKKVRKGKISYRVKWKGCSEDEATWEPAENCFCKDLIEQYENSHRQKKMLKIEPVKTNEDNLKSDQLLTVETKKNESDLKSNDVETETKSGVNFDIFKLQEKETKDKTKSERLKNESFNETNSSVSVSPPECSEGKKTSNPVEKNSYSVRENATSVAIEKSSKNENQSRLDDQILNESENKKIVANSTNLTSEVETNDGAAKPRTGFELGLRPRKVLGLIRQGSENGLHMLVAWDDPIKTPDVIPSFVANEKCPDLVIQYYEKHLRWKTVPSSVESNRVDDSEPKSKKVRH